MAKIHVMAMIRVTAAVKKAVPARVRFWEEPIHAEAMIHAMAAAKMVALPDARFWTEPIHVAAKTLVVRPDVKAPILLVQNAWAIRRVKAADHTDVAIRRAKDDQLRGWN
ncbi:MAG: hypothetical protein ACRD82_01570, partial [Blastocatellia bacterium]